MVNKTVSETTCPQLCQDSVAQCITLFSVFFLKNFTFCQPLRGENVKSPDIYRNFFYYFRIKPKIEGFLRYA